jgi:hypothetical protein
MSLSTDSMAATPGYTSHDVCAILGRIWAESVVEEYGPDAPLAQPSASQHPPPGPPPARKSLRAARPQASPKFPRPLAAHTSYMPLLECQQRRNTLCGMHIDQV